MEFKSIDTRERFLQVLNKAQLVDLGMVRQRQRKQPTSEVRFSGKSKGAYTDFESIYILSYSHPLLHFKSRFDPEQQR